MPKNHTAQFIKTKKLYLEQKKAKAKKKDIRILKNLFRNMVKVKNKAGHPKGTHIIINR